MLQIRRKLVEYQELFFLIYILTIGGMRAVGKGTFDIVWLSGIAFLCLGMKLVITDYTKKEMFWMVIFAGLVLLNFFISREKTLFLTMISVYGAKNINIKKVFLYSLWSKLLLFGGQVLLVCFGIIDGKYNEGMPKYFVLQREWGYYRIPCLGFTHPNYTYLSIIMIALLAVAVYGEKLKWYMWGVISVILFLFYKVLLCRMGWYVWLIAMIMVIFYKTAEKIKLKEIYIKLICMVPVALAIFSLAIVILQSKGNVFASWVNQCLTGRIGMAAADALPKLFTLLGNTARTANEIAYIQWPYNYGWILYIAIMIIYTKTMMLCAERKENYYVIVFAVVSFYFWGEAVPLSVGWNTSLLLAAGLLFGEDGENYVPERIDY